MDDYSSKLPLIQRLGLVFALPLAVLKRFRSDRLPRHAAALAFSSLLALAPMMAIALAMLSLFSPFDGMESAVETFIYQFLVPTAGEDIKLYMDQFANRAAKLTAVGAGAFFLTALLLLSNIESSFNDIWRVKEGRTMGQKLTVYWAMVTLGPILMGASLTMSTYFLSLSVMTGQAATVGTFLIPVLLECTAFLLLYLVMPNVRVSLMHALVGALVASILFELTKKGFVAYVGSFANYEVVYGALAALPIFLIWVYLSWVVALIGAEVVAVLQQKKLLEHTVIDRIEQNLLDSNLADNERETEMSDNDPEMSDKDQKTES